MNLAAIFGNQSVTTVGGYSTGVNGNATPNVITYTPTTTIAITASKDMDTTALTSKIKAVIAESNRDHARVIKTQSYVKGNGNN
jgi:hypothetical protein